MRIVIGDHEIKLVQRDVAVAKKLIREFMASCKRRADEYNAKTFYYTLICVMYVMSSDMLKELSPEYAAKILNAQAKSFEKIEAQSRNNTKATPL